MLEKWKRVRPEKKPKNEVGFEFLANYFFESRHFFVHWAFKAWGRTPNWFFGTEIGFIRGSFGFQA